jgi:hypothetical protein
MTLETAITVLDPVTLGQAIRNREDIACVRLDLLKDRQSFTEEELPEGLHRERMDALEVVLSYLKR